MTCKAIKINGKVCGCKTATNYCGRHKHYININKSLFSEDEPPPPHLTINFMCGDKIEITDNAILSSIDNIKHYVAITRETKDIKYSLFLEGREDEISIYKGECVLFCLFRELEKKYYNKYVVGAKYSIDRIFYGGHCQTITYMIIKRTKCFITIKNDRGEEPYNKKIITSINKNGVMEDSIYTPLYHMRSSNWYVMD